MKLLKSNKFWRFILIASGGVLGSLISNQMGTEDASIIGAVFLAAIPVFFLIKDWIKK